MFYFVADTASWRNSIPLESVRKSHSSFWFWSRVRGRL